jgi:hypothetical protein
MMVRYVALGELSLTSHAKQLEAVIEDRAYSWYISTKANGRTVRIEVMLSSW